MAAHPPATPSASPPPNLCEYARINRRKLKERLVKARADFCDEKNAKTRENLEHYLKNDDSYDYETAWYVKLCINPLVSVD